MLLRLWGNRATELRQPSLNPAICSYCFYSQPHFLSHTRECIEEFGSLVGRDAAHLESYHIVAVKEPLSSCFAPGDRTTAQLLRHNRHSHLIKQPDKVTTGGLSVSNTYTLIACALLQPPLTYSLRITPTPSPPPALSIGRGRGKAVEYNLSPRGGVPIPAYFTPEVWRLFWQHVRYEQHQADMDNSAVTFYSNLRALDEFQRVVFRIIGTENWKCIIFCIFLLCALLTEHG